MSSITVRDIPPALHKRLKESAERNRRSLNAEILWQLENSPAEPIRKRSIEEIRERARQIRESQSYTATDEEIREAIRHGRP